MPVMGRRVAAPGTSPTTAMLLLTDRRWQSGAGRPARAMVDSGILADEHIDPLAAAFVAAADALVWQVPDDWFANGIDVTIHVDEFAGHANEPEGPTVARRALQHLAEQGDVDRAYALATADANRRPYLPSSRVIGYTDALLNARKHWP